MGALEAAGERAAALQHARVYEALVRDELGAVPDPSVIELGVRLQPRDASAALAPPHEITPTVADAPPARPTPGAHTPVIATRSAARPTARSPQPSGERDPQPPDQTSARRIHLSTAGG